MEPGLGGRPPSIPPKMRLAAFVALRNRNFLWYWLGMLASFNGMQMQMVARGWLVYTMTDSPMDLGLVTAGAGIPMVLFSLYGGAVADRVSKRNLLLVTRGGIAVITLVISLLISFKVIAVWHLMVSSVLSGLFMSFYMPGRQAFVMELVGKDAILNAVALNSMAMNICRVASPALAGILIKYIGTAGVYWLVTLSGFLVVFTLAMIPAGKPAMVRPNVPLMADMVEGLRYVRNNSTIMLLLLMAFVPVITAMPYQTLMPVFARSVFKAGETGLGLMMSSVGIGALVGSTFLASVGDIRHKGILQIITGAVFGLSLLFFSLSGSLPLAMFFLVFLGGGSSIFMTLNNTLLMTSTPEAMTGRVMSLAMMTFGLMPLASLPVGALAEFLGAPLTMAMGSAIFFAFIVIVALFHPPLRRLD